MQTYANQDALVHCQLGAIIIAFCVRICELFVVYFLRCNYAKFFTSCMKIRQKHLVAFYGGGEEGVVYLSSFCFSIPPFYHRVVKSNSKYDEEMKMKESRNE